MITKLSNNNQLSENNNSNNNSNRKKIGTYYLFGGKYSQEINPSYIKRESGINKIPEITYGRENNPFRNRDDNQNLKNNFYIQTKSANQYKIKQNNNNNNEYIMDNNNNNLNNNLNDVQIEVSTFTGNSSNFQRHSKNEVKMFLKEVKSKVDPFIFKEFIQNIKLLTNPKESNNGVDKNTIVEKVRILFGEQFKDLSIRFESIIGINNN